MLITVKNVSANILSTDVGAINPGETVSRTMDPTDCYGAAANLKPLVDAGRCIVTVAEEAGRLDSIEPGVLGAVSDLSVSTGKIIDEAVTADKIADATITSAKLAAGVATSVADLASVVNAKGASLVGVEDAATVLAATNVEAALAEIAKYIPIALADPGTGVAIPVTRSANIAITTAAAETNTLAIPTFVGQKLILTLDVRAVGDRVITSAQRVNQAGHTTITLNTAGDTVILEAITIAGALRWQVVLNEGATVA